MAAPCGGEELVGFAVVDPKREHDRPGGRRNDRRAFSQEGGGQALHGLGVQSPVPELLWSRILCGALDLRGAPGLGCHHRLPVRRREGRSAGRDDR
ncbi:MAG: hypothetical protein MZV64_09730 [Ignavibacteriales bacterium]|nr:hypothetical protein [Ignavibacteriales bacterium]